MRMLFVVCFQCVLGHISPSEANGFTPTKRHTCASARRSSTCCYTATCWNALVYVTSIINYILQLLIFIRVGQKTHVSRDLKILPIDVLINCRFLRPYSPHVTVTMCSRTGRGRGVRPGAGRVLQALPLVHRPPDARLGQQRARPGESHQAARHGRLRGSVFLLTGSALLGTGSTSNVLIGYPKYQKRYYARLYIQ